MGAYARPVGRAPHGNWSVKSRRFQPEDLWALDVLAEVGYGYDSSIAPIGRTWQNDPFRRFHHAHEVGGKIVHELPISTSSILGFKLPIAGGNYLRQLPPFLIRRAVADQHPERR